MPPMPAEILGRAGLKAHVTLSGLAQTSDMDIIPGFQAPSAWEVTSAFAGANIWISLPGMGSVANSVKKLNIADGTVAATCTEMPGVNAISCPWRAEF